MQKPVMVDSLLMNSSRLISYTCLYQNVRTAASLCKDQGNSRIFKDLFLNYFIVVSYWLIMLLTWCGHLKWVTISDLEINCKDGVMYLNNLSNFWHLVFWNGNKLPCYKISKLYCFFSSYICPWECSIVTRFLIPLYGSQAGQAFLGH